LYWHKHCSITGRRRFKKSLNREIDYEKAEIDVIEYSHGIIIGSLLLTSPEKVAAGIIRTAYLSFKFSNFVNNKAGIITAEEKFLQNV
jgi:hypothetical protein